MLSPSIEELLRRVEASSAELGQRATLLSNKLEEIQERLRQLPGKAHVEVAEGEIKLSFDRNKSGDWYLFLSDGETKGWDALTGASVLRKARAVALLPRLFAELEKEQGRQLEQLRSALETFPLDAKSAISTAKEGR